MTSDRRRSSPSLRCAFPRRRAEPDGHAATPDILRRHECAPVERLPPPLKPPHCSPPPNIPSSSRCLTFSPSHYLVQRRWRTTAASSARRTSLRPRRVFSGERDPRPAGVAPAPRVARVGGGLRRPADTGGRRARSPHRPPLADALDARAGAAKERAPPRHRGCSGQRERHAELGEFAGPYVGRYNVVGRRLVAASTLSSGMPQGLHRRLPAARRRRSRRRSGSRLRRSSSRRRGRGGSSTGRCWQSSPTTLTTRQRAGPGTRGRALAGRGGWSGRRSARRPAGVRHQRQRRQAGCEDGGWRRRQQH
jgi:hypothetical protein